MFGFSPVARPYLQGVKMSQQQKTEEKKVVIVELPFGGGTLPLRPLNPSEVQSGMFSHAATPFGSPTAANSRYQRFSFNY